MLSVRYPESKYCTKGVIVSVQGRRSFGTQIVAARPDLAIRREERPHDGYGGQRHVQIYAKLPELGRGRRGMLGAKGAVGVGVEVNS